MERTLKYKIRNMLSKRSWRSGEKGSQSVRIEQGFYFYEALWEMKGRDISRDFILNNKNKKKWKEEQKIKKCTNKLVWAILSEGVFQYKGVFIFLLQSQINLFFINLEETKSFDFMLDL